MMMGKCIHGSYAKSAVSGSCYQCKIEELEAQLKVKRDTSELHRAIKDLRASNEGLLKTNKHREKLWKGRVKELEAKKTASPYSAHYVHFMSEQLVRAEEKLEKVRELPRYKMTLPSLTQKHFKTVPDESGDWVKYSDIKSITGSKDDE